MGGSPDASSAIPFSYEHGSKKVKSQQRIIYSGESVSILPFPDGSFHIYADGAHSNVGATGLPAGTRLWGAVNVYDCNIKAISEILSK